MSLLQQNKNPLELEIGRVLRIPCKFIEGTSSASPALIENISRQLQATGKNVLPIVVKSLGEDKYQATFNIQILDAARHAGIDFVWGLVVDDKMQTQLQIEAGQLPKPQINPLTATEQEIIAAFEYIKAHKKGFEKVKPQQVGKAIVEYRKTRKLKSLSFLTKLKCGLGEAKLSVLSEFLKIA